MKQIINKIEKKLLKIPFNYIRDLIIEPCLECEHASKINNYKYSKNYKPTYQYICRRLVLKNRSGDVYGITIPRELVDKYDLLQKKFKFEISKEGLFLIKTKIEYIEEK